MGWYFIPISDLVAHCRELKNILMNWFYRRYCTCWRIFKFATHRRGDHSLVFIAETLIPLKRSTKNTSLRCWRYAILGTERKMKNRPQNHRPPATQATKRPVVLCSQLFFVNSRRRISNHFLLELQQKIKEKIVKWNLKFFCFRVIYFRVAPSWNFFPRGPRDEFM